MANMFDDEPTKATSSGNMFDDAPKGATKAKSSNMFDDDEAPAKSSIIGWDKFKTKETPGRVAGEAIAAADVIGNLPAFAITTAEKAGGQIAKALAPTFGKSKESIDRETDKLVKQTESVIGDPFSKAAKSLGLKDKYIEQSKVNQGMQAVGKGKDYVDSAVADTKVAKAMGMGKREVSLLTDVGIIGLGELAGKVAEPVVDRLGEKYSTPSAKERADYIERKAQAQKDFDFSQKQKLKEAQEKAADEKPGATRAAEEEYFKEEAPKGPVDEETGEIKEAPKEPPTMRESWDKFKEEIKPGVDKIKTQWEGLKSKWNELTKKEEVKADQALHPDVSVELPEHVTIGESKVPVEQSKVLDEEGNQRFQPVGGRPVAATHRRMPDGTTKIIMDIDQIKSDFEAKTWTEPKVEGVDPLPEDAFKTPQEYANFILEHEQAHGRTSFEEWMKKEGKEGTKEDFKGAYENAMNREAADAIAKAREAQAKAERASMGTEEEWNKYLKDNKKMLEERAQEFYNMSGINPITGPTQDFKNWSEMVKDAIGVDIREVLWGDHRVKNVVKDIKKALPRLEDRIKVFEAIQRHTVDALPERLKVVAKMFDNTMKQWGKEFYESGMLKGLLEDYASRIIKEGTDPSLINKAMEAFRSQMDANFGTTSKYQKSRVIDNYDMLLDTLEKHGIEIEKDLAKVAETYGKSMFKAQANAKLIKYLKNFELVDGYRIFLDTRDARTPYGYKRITGGQFDGYAVHPDIYKPIRFVMDAKDMNMVMRAMHTLSSVTKRINVGASLFHNTTLLVGSAFANSIKTNNYFNPVAHYKAMAEAYSKAFDSGRLKAWNDVGGNFGAEVDSGIGAMGHAAKAMDNFIAKAGGFEGDLTQKTVEWASKPQQLLDKITWDVTHDGSKLLTMEALLEKAMIDHPNVSEAKLMREIATHVNDVYGGIDWYGAARDSNKFLENLKMSAFSPEGRKYLQILEFAPDWTLSTLRVFSRAIPKNLLKPHEWNLAEGFAGLQKPLTAADHARRYQMRAMMYLFTVANALNISLSGHDITQNKEFFSIELGDGSAIHPFKHYSEAFHWLGDFNKTFINKLGFIPRWLIKSSDKSWEESWKQLGKDVLPFSISGSGKKGIAEAIGGFAGVPITGKHEGQVGGAGFKKNWERAMRRAQRKLGIPIKYEEDEE
jgi:hypothetical protein